MPGISAPHEESTPPLNCAFQLSGSFYCFWSGTCCNIVLFGRTINSNTSQHLKRLIVSLDILFGDLLLSTRVCFPVCHCIMCVRVHVPAVSLAQLYTEAASWQWGKCQRTMGWVLRLWDAAFWGKGLEVETFTARSRQLCLSARCLRDSSVIDPDWNICLKRLLDGFPWRFVHVFMVPRGLLTVIHRRFLSRKHEVDIFWFRVKAVNNYWMNWHETWPKNSCPMRMNWLKKKKMCPMLLFMLKYQQNNDSPSNLGCTLCLLLIRKC